MSGYKSLRSIISYTLLICLMVPAANAFAWPFGNKKKENPPQSSAKKSSPSAPVKTVRSQAPIVTSTEETFFDEEGDEESEINIPQIPQVPKNPAKLDIPEIPSIPNAGGKLANPINDLPQGGVTQDPELLRIQNQINDIIKINEGLKSMYAEQAAEIQQISEQARIHQKILQDLEDVKKVSSTANTDSYMNQQKLKLIQQETEKNKKFIDSLKHKNLQQPQKNEAASFEEPVN